MCEALGKFHREFARFAESFDLGLLAPGELGAALTHLAALEKIAAALTSMVAARMAKAGKPGKSLKRAARELARASGTSMKEAERAIWSAEVMGTEPELEAAARSGGLSRRQAAIVAEGAAANPGAARGLLDVAASGPLSELALEAARAKAVVSSPGQIRDELRRARSLRSYTGPDGAWHLHAQGLPEDGAKVMAAFRPLAERAFCAARSAGRREAPEAYAFDALVGLATSGGGGVPPTEVVFRVDLDAFFRGYPAGDEVVEVAGFGPTSAQAVADVLEHGSPFLKAVMTRAKDVVGVAHPGQEAQRPPADRLGLALPDLRGRGLRGAHELLRDRPPRALGQGQGDRGGPARPALQGAPCHKDLRGLGARRGQGQEALRRAERPPPPPLRQAPLAGRRRRRAGRGGAGESGAVAHV